MTVAAQDGNAVMSRETWTALGTTAVLCAPADRVARARAAVQRELDEIDLAASRFRPDSELVRANALAGTRVAISGRLLEALRLAMRAAILSGGAVDPALGGDLAHLGYDRDWTELDHVPVGAPFASDSDPRPARRRDSWRSVALWDDPPAVCVPEGVALDLGATAKALAADRAAAAAHRATGGAILVSLGGDIATAGDPPGGGWAVRVTDDHRDGTGDGQNITIQSGGLATSSLVPRRWYHGQCAVHHILDPETGTPVTAWWRTVSVAAATCADANIASTAALVLGEGASDWLAGQGVPARLVAVDGRVEVQGGWPR